MIWFRRVWIVACALGIRISYFRVPRLVSPNQWQPLAPGSLKLNVDATLSVDKQLVGVGLLQRCFLAFILQ
ncbi:hypothetical protein ACOSQ4_007181 [Xanthoceras sorbifolium]